MKFTILSHAGMLVEHNGKSILFDPWIVGSCYWRSWWNFPEPDKNLIEKINPDFIYLTHLHWDHFHGPSLRRFDRKTKILIPKVGTRRMVADLNWLGFSDITEIPHGKSATLDDDFTLYSYQFGIGVDSAVILQSASTTLFNVNDCKYFGLPLRALLSRFPKIDFVFRSHSSASAIPYCIEDYSRNYASLRQPRHYEDEFSAFAIYCNAKYAIPFASNHCFVHKETRQFNATAVTPVEAATRCNDLSREFGAATRAVVMAPGSSWDEATGFELSSFDYSRRLEYVDKLASEHAAALSRTYLIEEETTADFDSFRRYFEALLRSIPFIIRKYYLSDICFSVDDSQERRHWIVRFGRARIDVAQSSDSAPIVIRTAARILNDCTKLKMFSVWTASKRLSIALASAHQLKPLQLFFTILDAFELDMLPLSKNFRPRVLVGYIRRWREVMEALSLAIRVGLLRRKLSYLDLYPIEARRRAN